MFVRTAESRDRGYDHSAYGLHERTGSSFDRQRHYETDYYRDARERTLSTAGSGSGTSSGSGTTVPSGVGGTIVSAVSGNTGTSGSSGATTGGSGGSTSSGVGFYRSHSRSPCRFETPEPRYESRAREPFTLASVVHRDLYREDRGRRGERSYRHSRSRSPHSTHSRNPSPQRLASQATRPPRSHSGSGSHSRSSSSDSVSSTSSSTSGRWVKLNLSVNISTYVLLFTFVHPSLWPSGSKLASALGNELIFPSLSVFNKKAVSSAYVFIICNYGLRNIFHTHTKQTWTCARCVHLTSVIR